jgi:DNA recombination protein Rad52
MDKSRPPDHGKNSGTCSNDAVTTAITGQNDTDIDPNVIAKVYSTNNFEFIGDNISGTCGLQSPKRRRIDREYLCCPLKTRTSNNFILDYNGEPITVARMLGTKPLRGELLTRPGPGGKKLIYMSGESVSRSLNDIFGYDGWDLKIIKTEQTVCEKQQSSSSLKWCVAYIAHVRIIHSPSGTIKEDIGAGDSVDKHLPTAIQHAIKASVTDATKRAARHFGDKLGNILYQGNFSINSAPTNLEEALKQHDQKRTTLWNCNVTNQQHYGDVSRKRPLSENNGCGVETNDNNASGFQCSYHNREQRNEVSLSVDPFESGWLAEMNRPVTRTGTTESRLSGLYNPITSKSAEVSTPVVGECGAHSVRNTVAVMGLSVPVTVQHPSLNRSTNLPAKSDNNNRSLMMQIKNPYMSTKQHNPIR